MGETYKKVLAIAETMRKVAWSEADAEIERYGSISDETAFRIAVLELDIALMEVSK